MMRWLSILLLLLPAPLCGQQIVVSATIDTNHIRIGEPIQLTLQAIYDTALQVEWPVFESAVQSFPLIEAGERKQTTEGSKHLIQANYSITAFDTGFVVLAPIAFGFYEADEPVTDSLYTEPLLIRVDFVAIDTTQPYKPIKAPYNAPMTWREWLPYIAVPLMLVALGLIIWYLYKRQQNKPETVVAPPKPPAEPPHVVALRELQAIEGEGLWQAGQYKAYHDRVSTVLRTYVEHRFQLEALESTTGELIMAFAKVPIPRLQVEQLREVLTIADLAKFAKVEPTPEENTKSLALARNFVLVTQQVEQEGEA